MKRILWEEFHHTCMGRLWAPHKCLSAPDLHEVFYLGPKGYAVDRHNVVTVCNHIHIAEARTEAFKYTAAMVLCGIYGYASVKFYCDTAPFKEKANLDAILAFEGPMPQGWRVARTVMLEGIGQRIMGRLP